MCLSVIQYSKVNEKDLEQIIDLYEKYLNGGKYIRNAMYEAFQTNDYLGFEAKDGERVVGFFSGQSGISFTYPQPELEKEIRTFAGERTVYNLDGLWVAEEYRNQGIAAKLIQSMKECLAQKKMELVLVEMWIYPGQLIPAQKPLLELGRLIYEKEIPDFYHDLDKYHITCPVCGDVCKCGALINIIELR